MKKTILTVVAMMAMATATFAENASVNVSGNATAQYTMNFNNNSIAQTLHLNAEQVEYMNEIHGIFDRDMRRAAKADEADRKKLTKRAVVKDLAYMRDILTPEQYYKYRQLLQVTLNNRGIEM